jgi:hypothetical protein
LRALPALQSAGGTMASLGRMDIETGQNGSVLAYLKRQLRLPPPVKVFQPSRVSLPPVASPDDIDDPYNRLGTHPEVVERVWDQLGSALPKDSRRIIYSRPALVHPDNGTIFVLALGTVYGLRLPPLLLEEAIGQGAFTSVPCTFGGDMNTRRDLGYEWVFGRWLADEPRWCVEAYNYFGRNGNA